MIALHRSHCAVSRASSHIAHFRRTLRTLPYVTCVRCTSRDVDTPRTASRTSSSIAVVAAHRHTSRWPTTQRAALRDIGAGHGANAVYRTASPHIARHRHIPRDDAAHRAASYHLVRHRRASRSITGVAAYRRTSRRPAARHAASCDIGAGHTAMPHTARRRCTSWSVAEGLVASLPSDSRQAWPEHLV